jgi:hypothetical protein
MSLDLSSAFRTVFLLFGFGRFLPLHELFFLDLLTMAIHPNVAGQFKPFGSANSCSPERCPPVQAFWKRKQLPAKYSLESVVSPG